MRGQRHDPAATYLQERPGTHLQEAGWASGPVWTGAENLAATGIRSPDRPARRQSIKICIYYININLFLSCIKIEETNQRQHP
jgi:hypothetical protein